MDVIRVNKSAITAVEDYLEYRRIVGEDDGGILFTSEQYAAYKQQVLPTRLQNRLYVSCGVPGGMDCKLIGPETLCFCSHRYKQHQTDFEKVPLERPLALPCRVSSCSCTSYSYIHLNGSQPVRCRCKHSAQDHSEAGGRRCRKCSTCAAFYSPYTCSCGQPSYAHKTLVETKEERLARGMPVGQDVPYVAMGGLTGFSSLAEGFLRLENRRLGNPPYSGLELAGSRSSVDCWFEKADGACSQTADINSLKQKKSDLKTREDEDMAIFERRYKERLEMEEARKQKVLPPKGPRPSATPQRNRGRPEG